MSGTESVNEEQGPPVALSEAALSAEYVVAHADVPAHPPTGGDFHSAFPMPDGRGDIALVIGDVAGHGPEQTPQAEHMRELLSDCLTAGLSPAETLTAVNAIIEPDPHFEGFGTVFVGTLAAETGKLTYASGGHEPALIAPPDEAAPEKIAELVGTGPPVGAFPAEVARYEEHEAVLPDGGTLLLYTDGIPDARPPDNRREWLGLDRLKHLLAQVASLSPRRLISELLGRISAFCQGRFHDDVALLAVRRAPPPNRPDPVQEEG